MTRRVGGLGTGRGLTLYTMMIFCHISELVNMSMVKDPVLQAAVDAIESGHDDKRSRRGDDG